MSFANWFQTRNETPALQPLSAVTYFVPGTVPVIAPKSKWGQTGLKEQLLVGFALAGLELKMRWVRKVSNGRLLQDVHPAGAVGTVGF